MKLLTCLFLFLFLLTSCIVDAKRKSGSSSSSKGGSFFGGGKNKNHNKPPPPRTFDDHSHSNSKPSAPTSFGTSNGYNNKPTIQEQHHQQSSAPVSHSNNPSSSYPKQPAYNPYVSSGSGHNGIPQPPQGVSLPHSSAPYPIIPNHPHPNPSLGSSSYPSNGHHQPIYPQQSYPNLHSSAPSHYPSNYNNHASSYHPQQSHYDRPSAPLVPGKTVIIMNEASRPSGGSGIGSSLATGLAIGAGAGVAQAATSRIIDSIFTPNSHNVHTYPSPPAVGTPTAVHTTNNYYYGNSDASANGSSNNNQPQSSTSYNNNNQGQPGNINNNNNNNNPAPSNSPSNVEGKPSTLSNGVVSQTQQEQNPPAKSDVISDEDIMKLTNELFDKQDKNFNDFVELKLQKQVTIIQDGKPVPDEASEPLFNLKSDLNSIPTIAALKALYDNYQRNGTQKEIFTNERRNEEDNFLNEITKTPLMIKALDWLAEKKFVESNEFEKKDMLRRLWFNNFDETSSGFERIFLSELFGENSIIGMQNWLYFADLESKNKVDYLGYIEQKDLSGKGSLLKLNYKTEGVTIQGATIFVGTTPELEMALYTVCAYARNSNWCPVSLGGVKFFIYTHSFSYLGKDLIDLGFPAF